MLRGGGRRRAGLGGRGGSRLDRLGGVFVYSRSLVEGLNRVGFVVRTVSSRALRLESSETHV